MADNRREAITEGVERSFDFWLSQHPETMNDLIEFALKEAFEKALSDWLDANREWVLQRVSDAISGDVSVFLTEKEQLEIEADRFAQKGQHGT